MSTIPDPAAALDNPQDAPRFADAGDAGPDREQYERPPFPAGSPVQPLGIASGIDGSQKCFYLNYNGQLTGLEAGNRHGKNSLIALYGPKSHWLEANWPQWSAPQYEGRGKDRILVKPSEIVGFDQAEASRGHIEECVRKGIFDPAGRMRGRGAHRMGQGKGLVLHCGDALLVSELKPDGAIKKFRWREPGLFDRMVYQAAEPIPRPHHGTADTLAAEKVAKLLMTWNFKRGTLDARFVLGAIGGGMLGGWLPWRPNVWITGQKGTGKSALNGKDGVVHRLFGDGVFRTGNASAAGIRQSLKNSTVPVMFDEIEAGADNRRVQEVIELARVASSGDTMTRGSSDHTAQEFTLQSAFWFSSINIPPLASQDRSRLAILELVPFADGTPPLDLSGYNFPELGRQLMRRMVDGCVRLEATKHKFHLALSAVGHDSRACDQFGTLLACADVLLHDWDTEDGLPDDEEVNDLASKCRPQRMAEVSEATPDHVACSNHIITSQQQSRGNEDKEAIGTWVHRAVAGVMEPLLLEVKDRGEKYGDRLQQLGLKLVHARQNAGGRWGATLATDKDAPMFLAVAAQHQALAKIFEGTTWQGGVWKQALARHDHAIEGVTLKFGHAPLRAVLVPLSALLDDEDLPNASKPEALAAWMVEQSKGAGA